MNTPFFIASFLLAFPLFGAGVYFPSASSSTSPDGKWKVTCQSPIKGVTDLRHVLLFTGAGRTIEIRRIDRDCSVLWSPDSSRFAVTDNYASDRSDIFIYSAAGRVLKKSVWEQFPTNAIPREELTAHCYFDALEWPDPHRLRFRIYGHTDEPLVYGFEHQYVFNLTTGTFKSLTKERAQQPSRLDSSGSQSKR